MDAPKSDQRKYRARGRWILLRQAILKLERNSTIIASKEENASSIHRFRGYNLLKPPTCLDDVSARSVLQSLTSIQCLSTTWTLTLLVGELKIGLMAIQALNLMHSPCPVKMSISPPLPMELSRDLDKLGTDIESSLRDDAYGPFVVLDSQTIQITLSPSSLHVVRRYALEPCSIVVTRERAHRTIRNLQELVSNQHHDGVDNTGNLCVWDAEKTLAWALLQESGLKLGSVTELGSGTAALAALALASAGMVASNVYVTDGHEDSVWNNRVNVRLMSAAAALPPASPHVVCQRLLWTCEETRSCCPELFPPPAEVTLVSDCTHFEEHHGGLFWTLVECTLVGGCIWMCQPNRGQSWRKFAQVVDHVNAQSQSPLLQIQERFYDEIERRHLTFLNDESYQPDIHKPRIFVLAKLREATEVDRLHVLHYMNTRAT